MRFAAVTFAATLVFPLHASVVGTSEPAPSLTAARVAAMLPAAEQKPWLDYLRRSAQQLSFDQDELSMERNRLSGPVPPLPKESGSAHSIPLNREAAYYRTPEAITVANTVLSFQLPNGGWSKNLDMSGSPRLPGQSFMANNLSHFLGKDDFDTPANPNWNYGGTLDNDATNTELRYLARISTASPGHDGDRFRAAFIRGVYYLMNAQYPNGGWPQVWPLEGGYHDAITFNDNAVSESVNTLTDVANAQGDYAFVAADVRKLAAVSAQRGTDIILRCQIKINGKLTIWAQQHDPLTLQPVSGRNFEPAALSSGESSDILLFLMKLPNPSPAIRASIDAGVAWLRDHAVSGQAYVGGRGTPDGRHLVAQLLPDYRQAGLRRPRQDDS
jgi:PelA/Pel-15E family pectate lyase